MEEKQTSAPQTVEVPTEVLAELIANQELLAANQSAMIRTQRDRRVLGWLKFLLFLGAMVLGWWYSQHMIFDLFGKKDTSPFEHSVTELIDGKLDTLKKQVESRPFGVDQSVLDDMGLSQ